MKKRVLIFICLLIAAALSMQGCISTLLSYVQTERRGPAMWIVEDKEGHRCYLFATSHIGQNDSLFPLPDVIEDAYSYCSSVAFEYDFTLDSAHAAPVYEDGTTIKDHIAENVYNAAVAKIKDHERDYDGKYDNCTAAVWYSVLENIAMEQSGFSSDYGTEAYIMNKAKADGKTVRELEGAEYLEELESFVTDKVYESFIISILNNRNYSSYTSYDTVYKNGDLTSLTYSVNSIMNAQYQDAALSAGMQTYYEKFYKERNRKIADEIMKYLSSGERVFVCVECSHIVGTDGVAANLQSGGYKVIRK